MVYHKLVCMTSDIFATMGPLPELFGIEAIQLELGSAARSSLSLLDNGMDKGKVEKEDIDHNETRLQSAGKQVLFITYL